MHEKLGDTQMPQWQEYMNTWAGQVFGQQADCFLLTSERLKFVSQMNLTVLRR